MSLRGATPGAAMPLSFLCLETLLCALAQHPPILTHVECHQAMGKLGPEGWDGGVGGWGGAAGGWGLQGSSCLPLTGAVPPALRPCLSSQIDFPLSFSPSPICSCSDSRLQPCLLGERRCPRPAAGSRCSVVPMDIGPDDGQNPLPRCLPAARPGEAPAEPKDTALAPLDLPDPYLPPTLSSGMVFSSGVAQQGHSRAGCSGCQGQGSWGHLGHPWLEGAQPAAVLTPLGPGCLRL